jgi:hypothetical protein
MADMSATSILIISLLALGGVILLSFFFGGVGTKKGQADNPGRWDGILGHSGFKEGKDVAGIFQEGPQADPINSIFMSGAIPGVALKPGEYAFFINGPFGSINCDNVFTAPQAVMGFSGFESGPADPNVQYQRDMAQLAAAAQVAAPAR